LSCEYQDNDDNWTDNTNLGEASNTGPVITQHGPVPLMYWLAANPSNDILVATI
jgi:hypothetical protein